MSDSISVTEVRNALRCPRLFILGRRARRPVAFPVGESWLGAVFHQIVSEFSIEPRSLRRPESGAYLSLTELIQTRLLTRLASRIESDLELRASPQEIDDVAEALRQLAAYVGAAIEPRSRLDGVDPVQILGGSELSVESVIPLPGADPVRISGRIDGLLHRANGEIELLEYKLTSDQNAAVDEAQVSLYQWLLADQNGVHAEPVVLRFQPSLEVTRITKAKAQSLVQQRILPLLASLQRWEAHPAQTPATTTTTLCASCPVQQACREFFPADPPQRDAPESRLPRAGSPPEIIAVASVEPRIDQIGEAFAKEARSRIEALFTALAIPATITANPSIGARLVTFELTIKRSGRVSKLDQSANDLVHHLHAKHAYTATFEKRGGQRKLVLVRPVARDIRLTDLLDREREWLSAQPGRLVLGEASDGSTLRADLSEPSQCHLLVGGTTGSGKSVLLKALAISLVRYHAPSLIQITLVDPKRVTFAGIQKQLGPHLAQPLCFDSENAVVILEDLVDVMEDRYRDFERQQVENITEYNELHPRDRFARHVVLIDEFQDLLNDEETRIPFEKAVRRLGAKARAAGIHLILATQRPDAKTIPPIIKSNLPGKLALKVQSSTNSRIILDKGGAEELLGRGDLLADLGQGIIRAQVASP